MTTKPRACVDYLALVEDRWLVAFGWAYSLVARLSSIHVREPTNWPRLLAGDGSTGDLFFGSREDVRAHLGLDSSDALGFALVVPRERLDAMTLDQGLELQFRFAHKKLSKRVALRRSSLEGVETYLAWYTEAERAAVLRALGGQVSAQSGARAPARVVARVPEAAVPADGAQSSFRGALEKFEDGFIQGWAVSTRNPSEIVEVELCVNDQPALHVLADRSRGDVARRGLSAGLGGYRVALPFSPLASSEAIILSARERSTKAPLGQPLRVGELSPFAPRFLPGWPAATPPPVTVVITVYDAAEELAPCLESVRRNTRGDVDVLVIDDASPSSETREVLDRYRDVPGFRVVRNDQNLGYTASINRGIREARPGADVILLNSDTRVPPRWVQTLRVAAYSGGRVGTATALSNNAGAFSVPVANRHNPLPDLVPIDVLGRRLTQGAAGLYPEIPTGNGFCTYVRGDYLREVGSFDEAAFPRGYGEENDFCMRGVRLGWTHVVDDRTYVGHTRSASFKEERAELIARGRSIVESRYPEYSGLVKAAFDGPELTFTRLRSGLSLTETEQLGRPRLLFVISTATGGTPQTNRDLMQALSGEYDCFLLRSDMRRLSLNRLTDSSLTVVAEHVLAQPITPGHHVSDEYDSVLRQWLWRYAIELVHVRHIAWHGLGLTAVAKAMDIPIVFSFHDYYTACPSVKLLDENLKHCGGICTPWTGIDCSVELWSQSQFPRLKGEPVLAWRARMDRMLGSCSAFVTTSESAAAIVERTFPRVARRGIQIIPHGRDFDGFSQLAELPRPGEKVRVVVPGNLSIAKGALVLRELIEKAGDRYEFHLVGQVHPSLQGLGTAHGPYGREELSGIIADIRPAVGLILSIWPETYCHTLTELWSCGVPVIAFDTGAVGERLRETPGGWLVKEMTADKVLAALEDRAQDPLSIAGAVDALVRWSAVDRGLSSMSTRYKELYLEVL